MNHVPLIAEAGSPEKRRREPVTCGVPWPRGILHDAALLVLFDDSDQPVPLQTRILDRWADQSVRWVLLDWQATVNQSVRYELRARELAEPATTPSPALAVRERDGRLCVDTGAAQFTLANGGAGQPFPFQSVETATGEAIDVGRTRFEVQDEAGLTYVPRLRRVRLEETGPLRACICLECDLHLGDSKPRSVPLLEFIAYLHFFAGSATVRFHLTLRNPRRAEHPGGLWDLGDGGSVYIRDAAFTVALPADAANSFVLCSPEIGAGLGRHAPPLELYQDSSGGENWRSSNHLNRHHVVPNTFRGYHLRASGMEQTGLRAMPTVALGRGRRQVAAAMRYFWQNFPKAIEATADELTLRLFPGQYADVYEIQGGEQKTHVFHVAFGSDGVTEIPLDWCRSPLLPHATPEWYCASGVIPHLTTRSADPNPQYLQLVDAAVASDDAFERKREVIDEYGWRHFGDVYGDHEAVFHKGPAPLVSHYNNQYDAIAGLAIQYLRSGDARWWRAMHELAGHVADIDIYHTDRDKMAYNHGLFWHTVHYVDADTGTHRSYPSAGRDKGVRGGGPANEQNYTTGLMLHHFLTGDPLSRESALGLARWVIDMDDGTKTVFRWLCRGYTGAASSSRTPHYHGPGRGAANSIAALLDGHRLSGDVAFLVKAEQLIRRCIHPADDMAARNLLDAENRWFYLMFLQTLGRYLDYKAELGQLDTRYAYARASLLHYARWMVDHEYPYLDKPEILEYPTESWTATDMRKSEIFIYAVKHAAGGERSRFLERSEFFFRSTIATLAKMKTRTLCRPVVMLLPFGFMQGYFQQHPDTVAPMPTVAIDFGKPEVFVPQKVVAKQRLLASLAIVVCGFMLWMAWLLN